MTKDFLEDGIYIFRWAKDPRKALQLGGETGKANQRYVIAAPADPNSPSQQWLSTYIEDGTFERGRYTFLNLADGEVYYLASSHFNWYSGQGVFGEKSEGQWVKWWTGIDATTGKRVFYLGKNGRDLGVTVAKDSKIVMRTIPVEPGTTDGPWGDANTQSQWIFERVDN